jgi:hypothetical protein
LFLSAQQYQAAVTIMRVTTIQRQVGDKAVQSANVGEKNRNSNI